MENTVQIVFSGVVAISTVIYAILTWKLVVETKKIREFQLTPDIQVFLDIGKANTKLIYLNIVNSGFGTAKNITFNITNNFNNYQGQYFDISTKEIIKNGMRSFYPNQKFRYFLFSVNKDNYDMIVKDVLEMNITFQDILGNNYKVFYSLPVKEMLGVGNAVPPDDYIGRIPYYLDKLNSTLSNMKKSIDDIGTN